MGKRDKMSEQMKHLEKLMKDIYGVKNVNYHFEPEDDICYISRGTEGTGLMDELAFTPYYSDRLKRLFRFTFCPIYGVKIKFVGKKDYDTLQCITNFCKSVGIETKTLDVLDPRYNYAYACTSDSPFKVLKTPRVYAPHGEIVVCCSEAQTTTRSEQKKEAKNRSLSLLKLLEEDDWRRAGISKKICELLCEQFVPLLFDIAPDMKASELQNEVDALYDKWEREMLSQIYGKYNVATGGMEMPYPLPLKYIIVLDSKYEKLDEVDLNLGNTSGWYIINDIMFPSSIRIPAMNYKSKVLYPPIDRSGMIRGLTDSKYRIYYKMNGESGSRCSNRDLQELMYKRYKQDYADYHQYTKRYIEELLKLIVSWDLKSLIHETANESMIQSFCYDKYGPDNAFLSYIKSFYEHPLVQKRMKYTVFGQPNGSSNKQCTTNASLRLTSELPMMIQTELSKLDQLYDVLKQGAIDGQEINQHSENEQSFNASELSFALLQWIGEVGEEIKKFANNLPKYYTYANEDSSTQEHGKKIREYAESQQLADAIDEMNKELDRMDEPNEQFKHDDYDDWESYKWGNWRNTRCNAFEEVKTSLERYIQKIKDMMIDF